MLSRFHRRYFTPNCCIPLGSGLVCFSCSFCSVLSCLRGVTFPYINWFHGAMACSLVWFYHFELSQSCSDVACVLVEWFEVDIGWWPCLIHCRHVVFLNQNGKDGLYHRLKSFKLMVLYVYGLNFLIALTFNQNLRPF